MSEQEKALNEIEEAMESLADMAREFDYGATRREQRIAREALSILRAALSHPVPEGPLGNLDNNWNRAVLGLAVVAPDVPTAEEIDAIRARHEALEALGHLAHHDWASEAHADRATLLRLLDAAREELAEERAKLTESARRVEEMQAALVVMSDAADQFGDWDDDDKKLFVALRLRDLRRARAALKGT